MTSFNDLPNEIIYNVIQYLHLGDPADMENLSLVCKTLHGLSQPSLQADHDLKQSYVSFRRDSRDHTSVENLLMTVFHDPRAVFMIERLYVVDPRPSRVPKHPSRTIKKTIKNGMKNSRLIREDEKRRMFESIRKGDRDSILAILLPVLPNIMSLHMEGSFNDGTVVGETVRSIARQNSRTVLAKLSEVNILPLAVVHEEPYITPFELLHSFATLPSVKTLSAEQMMDMDSVVLDDDDFIVKMKDNSDEENEEPIRPPSSFSLTTLNLRSSLVPTKILTRFLGECAALEHFEYTPAYCPLDPARKCLDYMWLTDSLLKAAKSSLKSLKFLIHAKHKKNLESFVSLRKFEVLCDIDVDMAILIGVPANSCSATEFPLLSEVLPASVQSLSLTHHEALKMASFQRLVDDLINAKAHNLPLLKKVEIHLVSGPKDQPLSPQYEDIIHSCEVSCLHIGLLLLVTQLWAYF